MKTTIQVKKITLNKLKELKIVKKESYEEVILRLIKEHEGLNMCGVCYE